MELSTLSESLALATYLIKILKFNLVLGILDKGHSTSPVALVQAIPAAVSS